jgi:hypothetical protein
LVFLGQNHHLGPENFLFLEVTKLPYHLLTPSPSLFIYWQAPCPYIFYYFSLYTIFVCKYRPHESQSDVLGDLHRMISLVVGSYFGMPPPLTLRKGDGVTWFLRFSKPNFVRKTMCDTIEKTALLSVYFFNILWIKKYFKGTLFSLKMLYLNKQGQKASSKISKHPDKMTKLHDLTVHVIKLVFSSECYAIHRFLSLFLLL